MQWRIDPRSARIGGVPTSPHLRIPRRHEGAGCRCGATHSVGAMERWGEVVAAGTFGGLALLAWRITHPWTRGLFVATAFVVWIGSLLLFAGLLTLERTDIGTSSLTCPASGTDSTYYPSHWSWIPPGEVCERPTGDVGPTALRIPFAGALFVIPVVAVLAWPRRPRRPSEDDRTSVAA
jgi:hypothetical protein